MCIRDRLTIAAQILVVKIIQQCFQNDENSKEKIRNIYIEPLLKLTLNENIFLKSFVYEILALFVQDAKLQQSSLDIISQQSIAISGQSLLQFQLSDIKENFWRKSSDVTINRFNLKQAENDLSFGTNKQIISLEFPILSDVLLEDLPANPETLQLAKKVEQQINEYIVSDLPEDFQQKHSIQQQFTPIKQSSKQ
eukprot:TRINITY_DN11288_c0_g1_i2.p1 TRINITY_DN11288_c0_g1~~TRINITY_DN11288_c0_g1_i2.p1  ORF type:complete len:195 (+),score=29.90 TRINITY_DN11288_c0_g1_i2:180-764(+)